MAALPDTEDLARLAEAALDAARRAGAAEADVLVTDGRSLSVELRAGRLERAESAEATEIGLRVIADGAQAVVAISDTAPDALREAAERAVAMARAAPPDDSVGLAAPDQLARQTDLAPLEPCDPAVELPAAAHVDLARACEAAAAAVPGVSMTDGAHSGHALERVFLAASNGFAAGWARSQRWLACTAITGEGTAMERDHAAESRVHAADMPTPEEVGREAGERAAARAGASRPPTGAFPVVFDERVAASLTGHLLAAINGTAIVRRSSWLLEAMGERVLPEGLDLIEEPHRPRMPASRLFDAEGLPTATRAFVEGGVLRSWVLDLGTGRRLGLASTANAARAPGSTPHPAVTSIRLRGGAGTRERLMAEAGSGLLVTSLIGATINPNTGDYSRGAAGFWFENGRIVRPVNQCTIAGNLRQMLAGLVAADDARPWRSHAVPSLLVERLTVAGG
ncbi:MAG: TldD/PmbA family protein [Alphaproteobacteria bacterium]|nr:MAG: TldD/PmbA family protein [Alphaproteobacteria bacterium]